MNTDLAPLSDRDRTFALRHQEKTRRRLVTFCLSVRLHFSRTRVWFNVMTRKKTYFMNSGLVYRHDPEEDVAQGGLLSLELHHSLLQISCE